MSRAVLLPPQPRLLRRHFISSCDHKSSGLRCGKPLAFVGRRTYQQMRGGEAVTCKHHTGLCWDHAADWARQYGASIHLLTKELP